VRESPTSPLDPHEPPNAVLTARSPVAPVSPPTLREDAQPEPRQPGLSTPDSDDLALQRLVSYRLDTPASPSVSLGDRRLVSTRAFSHLRHEEESARRRRLRAGPFPDVAARDRFPSIRPPQRLRPRDLTRAASDTATARRHREQDRTGLALPTPKGQSHRRCEVRPCGDSVRPVDSRCRARVATNATRPACSPQDAELLDAARRRPDELALTGPAACSANTDRGETPQPGQRPASCRPDTRSPT
jgi:hypothetical protein